jgi:choline dehydrogenase
MLRKDGLGATNHFETGGFIRSRAGERYPDIQYHFLPMAVSYDGSSLAREHGFQAHVGPMRSNSRGWMRLASAKPFDKLKVFFNYMSEPDDWVQMRACLRLTREIFAQSAFDPYRGREIQPGAGVQTDAQKTSLSVDTWRVPITPRARAGWSASMTRWPWSIPKRA